MSEVDEQTKNRERRWTNGPQDLPTDAKAVPHGILAQTIYGYQQLWLYPSGEWLNRHTVIEKFKIISWTRLVPEGEPEADHDR